MQVRPGTGTVASLTERLLKMCFGQAGFRQFPNLAGPGVEDNPSVRLQPSATAPVSDAGVLALAQPKSPAPPSAPRPPVGRYPGGPPRGRPISDLYGLRMFSS